MDGPEQENRGKLHFFAQSLPVCFPLFAPCQTQNWFVNSWVRAAGKAKGDYPKKSSSSSRCQDSIGVMSGTF
jgi:hypothetical protein